MNKVFIDTSALVAFFDRKDSCHEEAGRLFEKIVRERLRIIVTDYILSECVTTILMRASHAIAVKAAEFIFASRAIDLVWLDEAIAFACDEDTQGKERRVSETGISGTGEEILGNAHLGEGLLRKHSGYQRRRDS